MAPHPIAHGSLQHFARDFGQIALKSLQFFEGNFCRCPKFQNKGQTTTTAVTFP